MKISWMFGVTALFLFWLGAGCALPSQSPSLPRFPEPTEASSRLERGVVAPGVEVVRFFSTSTGTMLLFGFDQDRYRFSFVATNTRVVMREWMQLFPEAVAGINGVYFHEDLTPSGFFVGKGLEQGARVFDQKRSALLLTGERLEFVDTERKNVDLDRVRGGAQTYPVLIRDGHVQVTRDSGKVARRSWMGKDKDGRVWLGVLSDAQMSLHELAKRLSELPISWDMVVNLDGGPSTGVFVRGEEDEVVRETMGGVPNVLLVERR